MNKKFFHYSLGFWFSQIDKMKMEKAIKSSVEFMQTYGKGRR